MISDEMAYRQYLDGQEQAADLLVERYGDPLVYYLHGYLKDLHEAEDLMIEAFAQIFAKARPIHRTGSFKAYLYKTARNLALRHKRKHRIPFLRLEELPFEPQSDGLADTELLRSERERQLYAALEPRGVVPGLLGGHELSERSGGHGEERAAGDQPGASGQKEFKRDFGTGAI